MDRSSNWALPAVTVIALVVGVMLGTAVGPELSSRRVVSAIHVFAPAKYNIAGTESYQYVVRWIDRKGVLQQVLLYDADEADRLERDLRR